MFVCSFVKQTNKKALLTWTSLISDLGNLTKHMKSKAHMKKCVELGVSLTSVETPEAEEAGRQQNYCI